MTGPLAGVRVVSIAINLPGPAAAARLTTLGADVTTVLPPSGDPSQRFTGAYFDELHRDQEMVVLDLKDVAGAARLEDLLAVADVLLTSSRPSALRRLGLDHANVSSRHTQLCQVDIVGHPGDGAEVAGHDLTYQAGVGLMPDGRMPVTTFVDLAAAERAAGEVAAALVERVRTGRGGRREVALSDVAEMLVRPVVHGLTGASGLLGGGLPGYAVYATGKGHVALAALEPHFTQRLLDALEIAPVDLTPEHLATVFARRSAAEWEQWARERDIPLVAVTDRRG